MNVALQLENVMNRQLFPKILLAVAVIIISEGRTLAQGFNSTTAVTPKPSPSSAVNATTSSWSNIAENSTDELESSGSGAGSGSGSGSGFGPGSQGTVNCPAVLRLAWNDQLARTPYAKLTVNPDTEEVTDTDGFIPSLFREIVSTCCKEEPRFQDNITDMFDLGSEKTEFDVVLPVMVNFRDVDMVSQVNVVPLLPNTGVVFLVPTRNKSYPMKMLMSIASTWPVLVLTLALSLLAGIVAWTLETRTNPDHFPTKFFMGTWEGFWWAFVSMTTVGYGDRSPKSVPGRMFAVIWILVGICICSIFTATLTTSLTTLSLDTRVSLSGSKVATMYNSIESVTAFNYQADVIRVLSVKEIRERLDKNEVVGALLDSYTIAAHRDLFPSDKFDIQEVIPQDALEYGARIQDDSLSACIRNFRYSEESTVFELLEFYNNGSLKSGLGESSEESKGIFDPDGLLFRPTLMGCLGLVGILTILGVIWEGYRYWRNRRKAQQLRRDGSRECSRRLLSFRRNNVPFHPPQQQVTMEMLDNLEKRLIDEIQAELRKLRGAVEGSQKNNGNLIPVKNGVAHV